MRPFETGAGPSSHLIDSSRDENRRHSLVPGLNCHCTHVPPASAHLAQQADQSLISDSPGHAPPHSASGSLSAPLQLFSGSPKDASIIVVLSIVPPDTRMFTLACSFGFEVWDIQRLGHGHIEQSRGHECVDGMINTGTGPEVAADILGMDRSWYSGNVGGAGSGCCLCCWWW